MTEPSYAYEGSELTLFAAATNWKHYWSRTILPYVHGRVIEVGAGLGTNTPQLAGRATDWLCLEPDQQFAQEIRRRIGDGMLPPHCRVVTGTLGTLDSTVSADSILYIDVLEHILDDRKELTEAARRLRPGGYLVVLSPAHPWLFSSFDAAIGHHRRYTRRSLLALTPPELEITAALYLDSCGLMASAANRWLLSASMPNRRQIHFWDKVLIRLSRATDPVTQYRIGKSVLAIWKRK